MRSYGGAFLSIGYLSVVFVLSAPVLVQYMMGGAGMVLLGSGIALSNFVISIHMFRWVEQDYLSRVAAIVNMLCLCTVPLFSAFSGLVVQYINLIQLFVCAGILICFVYSIDFFIKIREERSQKTLDKPGIKC